MKLKTLNENNGGISASDEAVLKHWYDSCIDTSKSYVPKPELVLGKTGETELYMPGGIAGLAFNTRSALSGTSFKQSTGYPIPFKISSPVKRIVLEGIVNPAAIKNLPDYTSVLRLTCADMSGLNIECETLLIRDMTLMDSKITVNVKRDGDTLDLVNAKITPSVNSSIFIKGTGTISLAVNNAERKLDLPDLTEHTGEFRILLNAVAFVSNAIESDGEENCVKKCVDLVTEYSKNKNIQLLCSSSYGNHNKEVEQFFNELHDLCKHAREHGLSRNDIQYEIESMVNVAHQTFLKVNGLTKKT